MNFKLIRGTVDIISVLLDQWEQTGELSDLDRRFLVSKIEELRNKIDIPKEHIPPTENIVNESVLTEFSIEVEDNCLPEPESNTETAEQEEETKSACVVEKSVPDETSESKECKPAYAEQPTEELESKNIEEKEQEPLASRPSYMGSRRGKINRQVIKSLYADDDEDELVENEDSESSENLCEEKEVEVKPEQEIQSVEEEREDPPFEESEQPVETETVIFEQTETYIEEEVIITETPEDSTPEIDSDVQNESQESQSSPTITSYKRVLGEVINQGTIVVGEKVAPSSDNISSKIGREKISSLRKSIGINDKYLMMQELFGGSSEEYERAIEKLDSFDDLDDAMLWIHDNYKWGKDSDCASLLVDMLVRKFL